MDTPAPGLRTRATAHDGGSRPGPLVLGGADAEERGARTKIELPDGETTITAALPAGTRLLGNVERATLPPVDDLAGAVRAALAGPRGLPRIGALVRPGATVTIAFDDHTTGSFGPIREVAIRAVLDELEAAGVWRRDVTLVCANALHRMLRPSELARLLGDDLVREVGARLICHDAEDPTLMGRPRGDA